jgi:2-oxoglutarate ferredoxin oxidoreductase subunit alpha
MTRGGGNGDYRLVVLGPASVQEMVDLTDLGFKIADKYRNPVAILADGMLGQMMEPAILPSFRDPDNLPAKPWAVTGAKGRERNLILAAPYTDEELIALNEDLGKKYGAIEAEEQRWEAIYTDDAEVVVVAFGTVARIASDAVGKARHEGIRVGMIRPISLWPFPKNAFKSLKSKTQVLLVVEMNNGQMIEDVLLARPGEIPVHHYGKGGGWRPTPEDVYNRILNLWRNIS